MYYCEMRYFFIPIATDMAEKILLGRRYEEPLHLFKVRWNDHLVSYFFSDVSLWGQYKYIAFNIFSCRILIISYKMLIITGISNEQKIN